MSNASDDDKQKSRSWIERITALIAREPQNREQLMEVLQDAEDRDILSAELLGMIQCILQVSEMQVREVMVPKSQMVAVKIDFQLNDLLPLIIDSGHSRFPVLDEDGQEVIGILLAKDILQYHFSNETKAFVLRDVVRPAIFTSQSKRLDILLHEFRLNRNHLAIVLDEYGHVAGLVTIEDVLEQIVGDIEDEYDIGDEDGHIKKMDEHLYIVKAMTPIEEFNEHFNTEFSDKEFDTIGGLVLQEFGHLPKRGETVKLDHFRFKVLHSDNRRIYLLEVKVGKVKKS